MQCQTKTPEDGRPLANFEPNIWGDHFLNYIFPDEVTERQKEEESKELKELVRKKLINEVKDPKEILEYLDAILRVGVAYHFENEIEDHLLKFHNKLHFDDCYEDDLYYVSLRFRLLRQHGFYASCDVFSKFKSEDGSRFKECLVSDVEGILSLYEASYLRVHGESILYEALEFSMACLSTKLNTRMDEQIAHSLKIPLHRRSIRLESWHQISFYESKSCHHKTLLRFAKLDFNLLQELHKRELRDFTRWSRELDSNIKLPNFKRDRVVEGYFWSLGAYYEPKYSQGRMWANKLFRIISIIDDLYDSYGKTQELESFTKAMLRWDKSCIIDLPDYMKLFYQAMLNTFNEIKQELAKEGLSSYGVQYAQQQLITTSQYYLREARWRLKKIVPKFEESYKTGTSSSGYLYIITAFFLGFGEIVSKDAFEWINENSMAPRAACIISRLLDDLAGHKFEQKRDHVASSIECYMKEFGTSEEEAYKEMRLRVEEVWKDLNQVLVGPMVVPKPLVNNVINLSRIIHDIYQFGEDGYTHPKFIKSKVIALLINPIAI